MLDGSIGICLEGGIGRGRRSRGVRRGVPLGSFLLLLLILLYSYFHNLDELSYPFQLQLRIDLILYNVDGRMKMGETLLLSYAFFDLDHQSLLCHLR